MRNKGVKFDAEKVRLDLISTLAVEEIAKVLTIGARKYSAGNWRLGMLHSRYIRAAIGHLFAHMRGETHDRETGLFHLAHAGCCIMFLLEYLITQNGIDDRWNEADKMPMFARRKKRTRRVQPRRKGEKERCVTTLKKTNSSRSKTAPSKAVKLSSSITSPLNIKAKISGESRPRT
jgi:hypothetical protein